MSLLFACLLIAAIFGPLALVSWWMRRERFKQMAEGIASNIATSMSMPTEPFEVPGQVYQCGRFKSGIHRPKGLSGNIIVHEAQGEGGDNAIAGLLLGAALAMGQALEERPKDIPFEGKGGQSGGAGASETWDEPKVETDDTGGDA